MTYYRPNNIPELIALALDRDFPKFYQNRDLHLPNRALNLGPGNKVIQGTVGLELPEWDANSGVIPFPDFHFNEIFAFHFFEHLDCETAIKILNECERVLKVGGVLTIACPHAMSEMQVQDLTHKSFWHEDTLEVLMNNPHYVPTGYVWKLKLKSSFIAGLKYRNLMVFYQLEKWSR